MTWTKRHIAVAAAAAALLVGVTGVVVGQRLSGSSSVAVPAPSASVSSSPVAGATTSPSPSPSASAVPEGGWLSGLWTGGKPSPERLADFAQWRGRPVGTAVVYPAYDTWDDMKNSEFSAAFFDGFEGRLVYGLPMLPNQKDAGSLNGVAAGRHDDVFTAIADLLERHNRGNSFIRIGLEANGDWFPWAAGHDGNTAETFKAAFQHVAKLLKQRLPEATIVFDISCGRVFDRDAGRLASLEDIYPGDDVVDVIGCDTYDQYTMVSPTAAVFSTNLKPKDAAGLQDVVDFARKHGKKWAVPEWSIVSKQRAGGGDNPLYIQKMYDFFKANAADLAFENYFNEPADSLGSSIWGEVQNPKAAAVYRKLWRAVDQ